MAQKLTGTAVAEHNSKDSCWVIVHGKAYDVTEFLPGSCASLPIVNIF
jgi:L-lactate dehydrogenase (cytochrome)